MAVSKDFIDAVDSKNKLKTKIMLKDIMLIDTSLSEFKNYINYAEANIEDLYDIHDGEELDYNQYNWNKDYMNEQMVIVINNFSKERIELLKSIVTYLYKDDVKEKQTLNNDVSIINSNTNQIAMGTVTVGVITTIAGVLASKTIIIVGGAIITAVGVKMLISE